MTRTIVEKHFDRVAESYDVGKSRYSFYYDSLKKLLGSIIPSNSKVCEIGCGTGDLISFIKPKIGYGMDVSSQMIKKAKARHLKEKNIAFSTKWPSGNFDYIFMSDVIEHLEDPEDTFKNISKLMKKNSIFINTMANPLWEQLLMVWEKLGWKMKEGPHKRISYNELKLILKESKLKIIKHDYKLLMPIKIPLVTYFVNKYLEKPLRKLAFIEYLVAVKS